MIQVGGLIVAALAAKRLVQADGRRMDKNVVRLFWSWTVLVAGAIGLVVMPLAFISAYAANDRPMFLGALTLFMPALIAFGTPWVLTRYVCRPLGMPRLAFVITRWFSIRLGRQMNTLGQVLATAGIEGARALAFSRASREQKEVHAEWLREQVAKGTMFHGGTVVALACIEVALGNRDRARDMFSQLLHTDFVAPGYWEIASEWLSLDAAERGAWHEIRARESLGRPKTYAGALIDGLVRAWDNARERRSETFRRMTWVRWALTPGRFRVKAFVTRAMEQGTPAWEPTHVHAAHVACLQESSVSCEHALTLADRWEARLQELPHNSASTAFRREVMGDLAALLERCDSYPELESLEQGSLRRELLERVSSRLEAELRRAFQSIPPSGACMFDAWHAWSNLARMWHAFESLVGASVASRLFQDEWYLVQTWAIAFHNDDKQYPLAHALYVWLAKTAKARGFDDGVKTHEKNTKIAANVRWSA